MKKLKNLAISLLLAVMPMVGVLSSARAFADTTIAGETFNGISTPANQWLHGGSGTGACLTAATSSAANSIPACSGGPIDSVGSGALRLTNNTGNQSGFAIYNTPISASEGLDIQFDMYQYAGTGADGIVFFLVNGTANPSQAGALGGSLGYSSNNIGDPGIVGGYVGVGFDRYGNFSASGFGNGGTGRLQNSVAVRGSEATNYQFVTNKSAAGALAVEATSTRASAKRHVRITVSTNNIMNVAVNYFGGNGLQTEISNINLNTINGAGSLPATFKFGFSAGTGGSNNIHEISGLSVTPLKPNVTVQAGVDGILQQGEQGTVTLHGANDAGAQPTTGTITLTDTLPSKLHVLSASGTGWSCAVTGQQVSCTRPGDGGNALLPGGTTPDIRIAVQVAEDANTVSGEAHDPVISTTNNANGDATTHAVATIYPPNDTDGVIDSVEDAAPNNGDANDDGDDDSSQTNVTSLVNNVTGKYVVLQSSGCADNSSVSVKTASQNATADGSYTYPAGLLNFTLNCASPGDTATITQYYYGTFDPSKYVLRKYNAATHTYQTITNAVLSTVTIGGQAALKAVYQITDGGPLDEDGVANGHIVDPAGPALANPTGTLTDTGTNIVLISFFAASLLVSAWTVYRRPQVAQQPPCF